MATTIAHANRFIATCFLKTMAEVANVDRARKFRNSNRCVERLTLVHLNALFLVGGQSAAMGDPQRFESSRRDRNSRCRRG